ncbi:MAG: glycosyltransferase family 2 protein [Candidatus Krumholzibacteriota bacterium]|nr:glycosyltransferase family 2 protein [Candidatus Krumholzibacteriota bacterium]
MRISGFSFVKNGIKLYYPVVESIKSILPICDEFVIAVGRGDDDDNTRERIAAIGDPKIKIIDTVWDLEKYPRGMENAHQTDIAKEFCSGDWLFYLQADEVIHEKSLPVIKERCLELLEMEEVEGLLFKYRHFWGDYDHYQSGHGWYQNEIRIIRNREDIHSWISAQSFRRIPEFDGVNYRQKENTYKLKVAAVDAYVYHYGWVRPPHLMVNKKKALDTVHRGSEKVAEMYQDFPDEFDYGPLNRLAVFEESHPEVMTKMIGKLDWKDKLQYSGKPNPLRELHKHEKFKYRLITLFEKIFNGGRQIGGFKNYIIKRGV